MAHEGYQAFGTDLVLPDILKLAEAFNIKGYRLTDLSNEQDLRNALQFSPALVEVEVMTANLPDL